MKKIVAIIPALEKNKYFKKGDLEKWGDTTLLEWKIFQAKKIKFINAFFVSTPSKKVINICKKIGVSTIKRKKEMQLHNLYVDTAKKFPNTYILWLNPTSPFLSPKIINNFIKYFKKKKKYKSAILTKKEKEYFFYKKKSINFNSSKTVISRNQILPLEKVSNGAYLITSENIIKNQSLIGDKPLFYPIDWLSSLEIKTLDEVDSFKILFENYLRNEI